MASLASYIQAQQKSVHTNTSSQIEKQGTTGELSRKNEIYRGVDILYSLTEFMKLGVMVKVEGQMVTEASEASEASEALNSLDEDLVEIKRNLALSLLDMNGLYQASRAYDAVGNLSSISFIKQ